MVRGVKIFYHMNVDDIGSRRKRVLGDLILGNQASVGGGLPIMSFPSLKFDSDSDGYSSPSISMD